MLTDQDENAAGPGRLSAPAAATGPALCAAPSYTWQAPVVPDEVFMHTHTANHRNLLGRLGGIEPVPQDRLRPVVHEVGDVEPDDLERLTDALARCLRDQEPLESLVHRLALVGQTVRWDPAPPGQVAQVRGKVRGAIAEVLGDVPGAADRYVPHIVIAAALDAPAVRKIPGCLDAARTCQVAVRFTVGQLGPVADGTGVDPGGWEPVARVAFGG